jgi:(1->4)-alpha-D-glucan 1-alpha-D-glucosylmutase
MRINVLSELPEEWEQLINKWNSYFTTERNMGYFFYQALLGAWPKKKDEYENFLYRFKFLAQKFLRETQEGTNWIKPNEDYERRVMEYLESMFHSQSDFLETFIPFQKKIDYLGTLNSLSAQVVRLGSPGVVDIYQGSEQLRYSLVDPDNRRLVDFVELQRKLESVRTSQAADLYAHGDFDLLKMYLIQRALSLRTEKSSFFLHAEYTPLEVKGEKQEHVIAYMRQLGDEVVIVLAARFYSVLGTALGRIWEGCNVMLPSHIRNQEYRDIFTQKRLTIHSDSMLSLPEVFDNLPFSILEGV